LIKFVFINMDSNNTLDRIFPIKNNSFDFDSSIEKDNQKNVAWYTIILLSTIYGSISVISLLGNVLIILAILNNRKMRTVTNYFILNLAIADIIIGLLVVPFQVSSPKLSKFFPLISKSFFQIKFQSALLQRWIFPSILCKIAPFAATLCINVSIFTLVAISIERYRVILYPFNEKLTIKQCYTIIVLIWLISDILGLVKMYNYNTEFDSDKKVTICGPSYLNLHKYETIFLLVIQYLIPFILILFSYVSIGVHIYTHHSPSSVTKINKINRKKVYLNLFFDYLK
jgi:hypothetical protein